MKKILKILGGVFGGILLAIVLVFCTLTITEYRPAEKERVLLHCPEL